MNLTTESYELRKLIDSGNFELFTKKWNDICTLRKKSALKIIISSYEHILLVKCLLYGFDFESEDIKFILDNMVQHVKQLKEFLDIWYSIKKRHRINYASNMNKFFRICCAHEKPEFLRWGYNISCKDFFAKDESTLIDIALTNNNYNIASDILFLTIKKIISIVSKKNIKKRHLTQKNIYNPKSQISFITMLLQNILDDLMILAADERSKLIVELESLKNLRTNIGFETELRSIQKKFVENMRKLNSDRHVLLDSIKKRYIHQLYLESDLLYIDQEKYIKDNTRENKTRERLLTETRNSLKKIIANLQNENITPEKIGGKIDDMAKLDECICADHIALVENISYWEHMYIDAQVLRILLSKMDDDIRTSYSTIIECLDIILTLIKSSKIFIP